MKTYPVDKTNVYLLSEILDNKNYDLLSELLGTFYIDQESGWVVFNRGKVIGKQEYNIDRLIYSLSGLDDSIFKKKKRVESEIRTNQDLMRCSKTQSELGDYDEVDHHISDEVVKLRQKIDILEFDLKEHRKNKQIYEDIIRGNNEVIKLIDSLQLKIIHNGDCIPITRENIVGYRDSRDMYKALVFQEESIISGMVSEIYILKDSLKELLINEETDTALYSKGIRRAIKIDGKAVKTNLNLLKEDKKIIESSIKEVVSDKKYKDYLNEKLVEYSEILDVSDLLKNDKLILDSKFEKITGTKKQKLILAYRCAALTIVSDYLGVKLPLILDSINRETDEENIKSILSFLDGMEGHQIILSSILDVPSYNKINVSFPLLKQKDSSWSIKKFE